MEEAEQETVSLIETSERDIFCQVLCFCSLHSFSTL